MNDARGIPGRYAVAALAVVVLMALAWRFAIVTRNSPGADAVREVERASRPMVHATQTPFAVPTPLGPVPLLTAQDAIDASMAWFPEDHTPGESVARLITMGELDAWRGIIQEGDDVRPSVPVWLVAILPASGGMIVDDLAPSETGDSRPIEGVWVAWDANGGFILGRGALGPLWPGQAYADVAAMPSQPLPIASATPENTPTQYPTFDPNWTPPPGSGPPGTELP